MAQVFPVPAAAAQIDVPRALAETCQTRQGLQITVGDFVHVVPASPHTDLYIARVESIHQENSGRKLLYVHWYYRATDLKHQPPSYPKEQEVYHTNYYDTQLLESVAGHCEVVLKTCFPLKTNERTSSSNCKGTVYFCEFSYSAEKGIFTSIQDHGGSGDSFSSLRLLGAPSTRGTAAVAKELAEVLLDVERTIPKQISTPCWADCRPAWILKTKDAKTIKDIANSLLELEECVNILDEKRNQPARDHSSWIARDSSSWRKTVSGIHTYDQIAKYVKAFKQDVLSMMANSVCNKAIRGIQYDHNVIKRKQVPLNRPNLPRKLRRVEDMQGVSSLSSSEGDHRFTSGSLGDQIQHGSIYKVDQKFLPKEAPPILKLLRAVLVAERTRLHVKVKFPSGISLQSYFGRGPGETTRSPSTVVKCLVRGQVKIIDTCMGTKPDLDEQYIMTPKLAERVLIGPLSCTEYLHQGHLWSFWVTENSQSSTEGQEMARDKGNAKHRDAYDEARGELGAAEALTQLIPGSAVVVRHRNRLLIDESENNSPGGEYGNEGPFKWGSRSLRRAGTCNRSGIGTSPNSCDTGYRDPSNQESKNKSRRSLDFINQNSTPFFLQTERSQPRSMDQGAMQAQSNSNKDKFGNTKNMRTSIITKSPKDMKGRWSTERYMSAQLKLIDIMHDRGAIPGKPILRPALREEARKHIGDTGLLDHLLKHMTDTVISNGERFRRRHNAEGAMEYWLEDASLMEIRKMAGIEDPSWIPPPGWKPGDRLPGRGEHGYGVFKGGMSAAESIEMTNLKGSVEGLKSDLSLLYSRVKGLKSRGDTSKSKVHLQKDKLMETTENCGVTHSIVDEKLREVENNPVLKSLQTGTGLQDLIGIDKNEIKANLGRLESSIDLQLEEQVLPLGGRAHYERGGSGAESQLETNLWELGKSVALMQEDVLCITQALGLLPLVKPKKQGDCHATSKGLLLDNSMAITNLQLSPEASVCTPSKAHLDERSGSTMINGGNVEDSNVPKTLSWGGDESHTGERKEAALVLTAGKEFNPASQCQLSFPHDRTLQPGFKTCNPSGSFLWPSMLAKSTGAKVLCVENVISPRRTQHMAQLSSCHGQSLDISGDNATARVIFNVPSSNNKDQFRPSLPQQADDSLATITSHPGHADHSHDHRQWYQRRKGQSLNWDLAGKPHVMGNRVEQATSVKLVGVSREPAHARDGLTILSVAAGCVVNDIDFKGSETAQLMQADQSSAFKRPRMGTEIANEGHSYMFPATDGSPDGLEGLRYIAAFEKKQSAKMLRGVKALSQAFLPVGQGQNSTATDETSSPWLGLAPPTGSNS